MGIEAIAATHAPNYQLCSDLISEDPTTVPPDPGSNVFKNNPNYESESEVRLNIL